MRQLFFSDTSAKDIIAHLLEHVRIVVRILHLDERLAGEVRFKFPGFHVKPLVVVMVVVSRCVCCVRDTYMHQHPELLALNRDKA
jgi:hypothetical protein